MRYIIKKKDSKNINVRNYEIDKNSKLIIDKYMKKIKIRDINIFMLLDILGFDKYNYLYLKVEEDINGIKIYYSENIDEFEVNRFIYFDYVMDKYIKVFNRDSILEYYIKREYPGKRLCLDNEMIVKRKNINGIEYYVSLYRNEFNLVIKDNSGKEIRLDCIDIIDRDKMIYYIDDMNNYIFNIRLDDNIDDIYNKFINMFIGVGFKKFNLCSFIDNNIISNYIVNNYNNRLEVNNIDRLKKVSYERDINKDNNDTNIMIKFINGEYSFVIEYLDIVNNKILNEMELINSFMKIRFPIKMDDLCKILSKTSIGNISRYLDISLKIYYNNIRKDVISIKNSKLDYFENIDNSKKISINNDGVFSYINEDDISRYLVEINGDIVTRYEQVNEYGINNDNKGLYMAIKDAAEEKIRVKKLVVDLVK